MTLIAGAFFLVGFFNYDGKNDRGLEQKGQLFAAALWKFAVGMLEDILFYSLAWSCVAFAMGPPRDQMKPTDRSAPGLVRQEARPEMARLRVEEPAGRALAQVDRRGQGLRGPPAAPPPPTSSSRAAATPAAPA